MPDKQTINRRKFLKKSTIGMSGVICASPFALNLVGCSKYDFDLILENGLVFDGSGKPPVMADVGVRGELIAAIGDLKNKTAEERLSVSGMAVSPGFIDIHTHTETELLIDPKAQSKIRQGVTTEMAGQCGGSVAPLSGEMREQMNERMQKRYGLSVDWQNFDGFYRALSKQGIAVNWMTMVGQGTLREYVIGMDNRPATPEELHQMQQLARNSLNEGVWGISSGLEYTPGSFASTEEIAELCSIMGAKKKLIGIYATHMRDEEDFVEAAVNEAINIARQAEVGLQISHLKAIGKRNWPKAAEILKLIEQAKSAGLRVSADRYPYAAYSTGLSSSLFPLWSREGGTEKFLERLQNPDLFARLRTEVQKKVDLLNGWNGVLISNLHEEKNQWMRGKRISEIVEQLNKDPFDFTRELLIEEKSRVSICGFGMSEENTSMILKHPLVAIGSDGNALSAAGPLAEGHPHPRNFGTFPRVLGKFSREEKLFPLQEALRKMTSLPASILGVPKRGLIQAGFFADLVVFDPDKVIDTATWDNPKQYPVGIPQVLVNGKFVIRDGAHTGKLPGKILTKKFNPV